jgi:uncharacterized protein
MSLVKMHVSGLTIDPFTNMPIVILKDESKKIAVPIWIGLIEASAIATEVENIELSRPMTHDIIKIMLENLGATVDKIEIADLMDNTFFSFVFLKHGGKEHKIDCRPSDAIAIALRTKADIFVDRKVIEKSRKLESIQDTDEKEKSKKWAEILENLDADDFGKYKM